MAITKRSAKLDTRTARLDLASGVRHQANLSPGRYLAYRRPGKENISGSWLARWYDPATKNEKQERLGLADDYDDADGVRVLDWKHAKARAETWFDEQAALAHLQATGETVSIPAVPSDRSRQA